jgi:hypothetical protein
MYKRKIGGKTYYYTSYKDKDGKIRNKYLGDLSLEALEKERNLKNNSSRNILTKKMIPMVILVFLISSITAIMFFSSGNFTGFAIIQEKAGISGDEDLWYISNSSETYQIDTVSLTPVIAYANSTLNCNVGSLNSAITSTRYMWFVNGSYLGSSNNDSSLSSGNFSVGNNVDCSIVPDVDSKLIAYWSFDEGKRGAVSELISNNSGNFNSINHNWNRSIFGNGAKLNQSYNITIRDPQNINFSQNFTISFWKNDHSTANKNILKWGSLEIIQILGKIRVKVNMTGLGEGTNAIAVAKTNAKISTWEHYVLTYNGSTAILYKNAVVENSTQYQKTMDHINGNITIGTIPGTALYYDGNFDELAFFNQSLTHNEIWQLYTYGIQRSSKNKTALVDTSLANFQGGTCVQVNCSDSGNLSLSRVTGSTYYMAGNFTSQIFSNPGWKGDAKLFYNNYSVLGTNISLKVRTGVKWDNGSILWSEFSGPDPSHSTADPHYVLGIDFDEYDANSTTDKVMGQAVTLQGNDFVPNGRHGNGVEMYAGTAVKVLDAPAMRYSQSTNYTWEVWIKPNQANSSFGIFEKTNYVLHTDSLGHLVFNGTYNTNVASVRTNFSLLPNLWNHLLVTRSSVDNKTAVYLNGKKGGSVTTNKFIDGGPQALNLGGGISGQSKFNGTIDSFVMWNRTFSVPEINEKYLDHFTNSTGGEPIGAVNRYVQYKVFLRTNNSVNTPRLQDVSISMQNYTTFVYSRSPDAVSHIAPANGSVLNYGRHNFNWSFANEPESDILFYEFILSNNSNSSIVTKSRAVINNFSTASYVDDNYTVYIQHFTTRDDLQKDGWLISSWAGRLVQGKFGRGINLNESGVYAKIVPDYIPPLESGTIEFWVKPSWNGNETGTNYFFDLASNDQLEMNRTRSLLSLNVYRNSTITYNISSWEKESWHHVAVTWKAEENISLIIDGERVNQTSPSLRDSPWNGFFFIGTNKSEALQIDAVIDELRISSVDRKSFADLALANFSQESAHDYADFSYFWKVRAGSYSKFSRTLDEIFSPWTTVRKVVMDTRNASITGYPNDKFRTLLTDSSKNFTLNTSESMTCFQRKYPGPLFTKFVDTGSTNHIASVNFSRYGNYTVNFQCFDVGNKTVNYSTSFYVFKSSDGVVAFNSSYKDFIANEQNNHVFRSIQNVIIGNITLTTQNNVTGKVMLTTHVGNQNPENNSLPPKFKVAKYSTYLVDEQVKNNVTGNFTIHIKYDTVAFIGTLKGSERLYWYNQTLGNWSLVQIVGSIVPGNAVFVHNTSYLGTFAALANYSSGIAAAAVTEEVVAEAALDDEIEEVQEPYEIVFQVDGVLENVHTVVDTYDIETGVIDISFALLKSFDSIFISLGRNYLDEPLAYKDFFIKGLGVNDKDISYLDVTYAIETDWVDSNANQKYIAAVDSKGKEFFLEKIDADEDYYYYYAALENFGEYKIFALSYANQEDLTDDTSVVNSLAPDEEESGEEEREEEKQGVLSSSPLFSDNSLVNGFLVLFYVLIVIFAGYFIARVSVLTVLTRKKVYPIDEMDLVVKEPVDALQEIKYYLYQNQENENVHQRLIGEGFDPETAKNLFNKVLKLEKGEFPNYIYAQLSIGKSSDDILSRLESKGWEKNKILYHIDNFRRI